MKHRVLIGFLLFFLSGTCALGLELGSLSGTVKDPAGQPAVGVAVALHSMGSLLPIERKTLSDLKGQFYFTSLFPGTYTLQIFTVSPWNEVSKILVVSPGGNDSLVIHLSDILTLAFKPPRITTEREDSFEDAKWILRTSRSTRPILRFGENGDLEAVAENSLKGSLLPFRGILEISSGNDVSNASPDANSFNSSFAFIHSLSPSTQLLVAGGVGFSGSSQASVCSALNIRLDESHTATVSLGLRQFGLPLLNSTEISQAVASLSEGNATLSQVQNFLVSLDLQDRFKIGDHLE
ncbi:MAG: carboxypeptidase-like regulatory domain-containing protein, partial [Terriglobia bacterium]